MPTLGFVIFIDHKDEFFLIIVSSLSIASDIKGSLLTLKKIVISIRFELFKYLFVTINLFNCY